MLSVSAVYIKPTFYTEHEISWKQAFFFLSIKSENFTWSCKYKYFWTGNDSQMYERSWPVEGRGRYCQIWHTFFTVWHHRNTTKISFVSLALKKGTCYTYLHYVCSKATGFIWLGIRSSAGPSSTNAGGGGFGYVRHFLEQQLPVGQGLLIHEVSRSHKTTHHSRQDSSVPAISSLQTPLPDKTQHSQQTSMPLAGLSYVPATSVHARFLPTTWAEKHTK